MPLAKMNGIYNANFLSGMSYLDPVFALCPFMRAIKHGVSKE